MDTKVGKLLRCELIQACAFFFLLFLTSEKFFFKLICSLYVFFRARTKMEHQLQCQSMVAGTKMPKLIGKTYINIQKCRIHMFNYFHIQNNKIRYAGFDILNSGA